MRPDELRTWTQAEIRDLREQLLDDTGGRAVGPPLSVRQAQVLHLLAEGLSYKEIAARLYVSQSTTRSHISALYGALGARNGPQAVHLGYQAGLLTAEVPRG